MLSLNGFMNRRLRKLVLATTLLIGVGVFPLQSMATNFDFSTTLNEFYGGSPYSTFTATFTGSGGGLSGITSATYQGSDVLSTVQSWYSGPGSPYGTYDTNTLALTGIGMGWGHSGPGVAYAINGGNCGFGCTDPLPSQVNTQVGSNTVYASTYTFAQSGGAPEIDGSLAPKIALLLGCSYLMFGRKKHITEPFLAS